MPWNLTAIPAAIRIVARRGHRRRAHDLAAELGAPRRRRGEAGDGRRSGSPTSATRSSRTRTAAPRAWPCASRSRASARRALVARSRRRDRRRLGRDRRGDARASSRAGRSSRSRTAPTSTTSPGSSTRRGDRFRITHTGSFFGKRDPRPFLTALAESGLDDVVARFVGDFRAADREWAESLGLGDRLELIPYAPRRRSLELQRDSEALLLLIPDAGGRGKGVLSGKVFEYLAAERPILAAVPPDGAAAELIRETGAGVVVAARRRRRDPRTALASCAPLARAATLDGATALRRTSREPPLAPRRVARPRSLADLLALHRRRALHDARLDELPLPRDALLRHLREAALEPRRLRHARRRARDRVPRRLRSRSSAATAASPRTRRRPRLLRRVPARLPDRLLQPRHARGARAVREGDGQVRRSTSCSSPPGRVPRAPRAAVLLALARLVLRRDGRERGLRRPPAARRARRRQPRPARALAAHRRRELDQHLRRGQRRERLPAERAHRRPEPPRDHADRAAPGPDAGLPAPRARPPAARRRSRVVLAFLLLVELATLSRSGLLGLGVGVLILALPYRRYLLSQALLLPLAGVARRARVVADARRTTSRRVPLAHRRRAAARRPRTSTSTTSSRSSSTCTRCSGSG